MRYLGIIVFVVNTLSHRHGVAVLPTSLPEGGFSWIVYGLGELIDKACDIERNTRKDETKSETQSAIEYEEIIKLEKLHSQGFLTDEEYQKIRTEILNKL